MGARGPARKFVFGALLRAECATPWAEPPVRPCMDTYSLQC